MSEVSLDPDIQYYATLPILVVMFAVTILRQNLSQITKDDPKVDMKQMKHNNRLARARSLKGNGAKFLLEHAYKTRKQYFCKAETGILANPPAAPNAAQQMAEQDPMAAMGPMKGQLVFFVIQAALGYWVNHLFNGFLVGKTPFPLTYRFKGMLQRGVDVENLEPGYISGLCWYFVCMFALGGIQALIMSLFTDERGSSDFSRQDEMMMMMGAPAMGGAGAGGLPGMGGGPDMKKIYTQEKESLDIHLFDSCMDSIEVDLWRKWKKSAKA